MEGDVQIDLYTGDIPSVFERFSELIGVQHWRKRVDLLKAEIKGNRLLKDHLIQENEIAFCLQAATELTKKYGRFPVHQMDSSPLFPCMAFAAQILSIAEASESTQRTQLVRRVHGALKNPDDMRGLRLELTAATHFLRRGLDVQWPEMVGGGTMDLVIPGLGPQGLEIECKSISDDKGRKIHKREALEFSALVAPKLNDLGKGLRAGVAAVLTLDGRLPGNFIDRKKLAQSVVRQVLSGSSNCQLDGANLRIHEFDPVLLGELGEDGNPVISRDRVDSITGTTNRQALIVGRKSGGAIVLVLQSTQDDSLLTYAFDTLSRSANRQLSGNRAGMFLVGLEGLEADSLVELAQQDSTGGQPPTALRLRVSDFLASQGRDHVVGVGFISKGASRPASGGVTDSGGSAYVFPKRESPFWHSDFSGLFSERV
jgi:hypothetical protein